MNIDPQQLMNALKLRARAMGLTQDVLAKKMGVSHPTLKRWLAGKGVNLEQLIRLLELLDLSWNDLAADIGSTRTFRYSLEQEEHFALQPGHLAYFDLLLRGKSPREIRRLSGLRKTRAWQILRALEKIQLIEIISDERVRLLVQGEPVWRRNGPLAKSFRQQAITEFCQANESKLSFALIQCSPADVRQLRDKLSELSALASAADRRARLPGADSPSYGLLVGLEKFDWSLLQLQDE